MVTINSYLNFPGNTEEAFNFYKSVFDSDFQALQRYKDTPDGEKMAEDEQDKIMHIALPIGNSVLMGTDALESQGFHIRFGNNFHLSVSAASEEEAQRIFNGLAEGGKVVMPLERTFWNAFFGMCIDKFGINWMINFDYK